MKVLKRPMFKYGGDVKKQGIMHKMNGLRDGGVATTMADATGYANGGMTMFPPMRGRVTRPGGYAGEPLSVQQQIEQQKAKEKALSGPKYTDQVLDQKFNKFIDNYYGGNQATDLYNEVEMLAPPTTAAENVFMQNYSTPEGQKKIKEQFLTGEFGNIYGFGNTKNFRKLQEEQEEFGIIPPRKNIESNETPEVNENELFLSEEGGDKSIIKKPKVSQKETDAARLKRAYEILGVDDAKKDAVYNSLIDLSQAQAIDTKDISGSINRAIGALSKRADKVTDLKDKAKAALASGTLQAELTKEINKEKGTPYDQKEKYFTGKYGDAKGERAAVGSPLSVFAALSKTKAGDSKSTRTEEAVTKYFDGIGGVPVYKGPLPGLELETINVGEKTETEDGAYRIGTGYIVVEKGIITEKKNLFPKK